MGYRAQPQQSLPKPEVSLSFPSPPRMGCLPPLAWGCLVVNCSFSIWRTGRSGVPGAGGCPGSPAGGGGTTTVLKTGGLGSSQSHRDLGLRKRAGTHLREKGFLASDMSHASATLGTCQTDRLLAALAASDVGGPWPAILAPS